MADYLMDEWLNLNEGKTHPLVMTTKGNKLHKKTEVFIGTQTEPHIQSEVEILILGCVHQKLNWTF